MPRDASRAERRGSVDPERDDPSPGPKGGLLLLVGVVLFAVAFAAAIGRIRLGATLLPLWFPVALNASIVLGAGILLNRGILTVDDPTPPEDLSPEEEEEGRSVSMYVRPPPEEARDETAYRETMAEIASLEALAGDEPPVPQEPSTELPVEDGLPSPPPEVAPDEAPPEPTDGPPEPIPTDSSDYGPPLVVELPKRPPPSEARLPVISTVIPAGAYGRLSRQDSEPSSSGVDERPIKLAEEIVAATQLLDADEFKDLLQLREPDIEFLAWAVGLRKERSEDSLQLLIRVLERTSYTGHVSEAGLEPDPDIFLRMNRARYSKGLRKALLEARQERS